MPELFGLRREPLENLDMYARDFMKEYDPISRVDRFGLIALLLLNGEKDDLVPLECASSLYEALKPLYKDALYRLRLEVYPDTGHDHTPKMEAESIGSFEERLLE